MRLILTCLSAAALLCAGARAEAQTIYLGQAIVESPSAGCASLGPINGQPLSMSLTPAGVGGNGSDSSLVINDNKEFMSLVQIIGGSIVANASFTSRTIIVDGQYIQKAGKVASTSANVGTLTGTEASVALWIRLTNYLGTSGCVVTLRANMLRFGGS